MRGAGSSHVNLCAASRDQSYATWPSAHGAEKIADFHAGRVGRPPMTMMSSMLFQLAVLPSDPGLDPPTWQASAFSRQDASTGVHPPSAGALVPVTAAPAPPAALMASGRAHRAN